jgi:hypothetical protein
MMPQGEDVNAIRFEIKEQLAAQSQTTFFPKHKIHCQQQT